MEEIHANIKGKVQAVMFRDFVQRRARLLHLSGWVKNLSDGGVEVVAQGKKEQLKELIELLKKGPVLAKADLASVEEVRVSWVKPKERFDGFKIVY